MPRSARALAVSLLCVSTASGGPSFVNWESPHVSPLGLTPDGARLLAVNTADNRLEVFDVTAGGLVPAGAVPVGLDPVSVRARSSTEAWVVNHVSDTISVVDLDSLNVVATLHTGDEPADVVFAGKPQRAFVSVSQLNQLKVYDPADLSAPPVTLELEGEDPRALATDGATVYAAIFEAGNRTTILQKQTVSSPLNPYADDPNPPPNDGAGFDPPMAGDLPEAPEIGHIVRNVAGVWTDDNGGDWTAAVTWDLHDHDVAIVDAQTLAVGYATDVMNMNMALAVGPGGSGVTIVGIDAINEVRFEPNLNGIFVRVKAVTIAGPGAAGPGVDLNPHLDYSTPTVAQTVRDLSIGDPRGIAWRDADRGFVTGMGSNNVAVVDGSLGRSGLIEVGGGPTGAVYDGVNDRVYVLNRFEGSISVIDAGALTETQRVAFFDPTPADVSDGRPFLYDTQRTSGLGQASCASCHVDGRMDQLVWDLGDPSGAMKPFNQECQNPGVGCEDWHPMKGPLVTQTLVGIIGTEPFHWRGDREDLAAFNPAFESLMGDDAQLTDTEMGQFEAFVATLTPPPNPFRNLDGSFPSLLDNGGDPSVGEAGFGLCISCHAGAAGTSGAIMGAEMNGGSEILGTQSIKIPQLRNLYEKTGFDRTSTRNNRGFGYLHDGNTDTLFNFLGVFPFDDQMRRDMEAFVLCFSNETHAGVGAQSTLPEISPAGAGGVGGAGGPTVADLLGLAEGGEVGLVVKGLFNGEQRGYYRLGDGTFQSDRAAEIVDEGSLLDGAAGGAELTFTIVPLGSEVRIGVDRDEDGFFDRDELDAGSDPADPGSTPGIPGDLDGDGDVDVSDFLALLMAWGPCPDPCPPSCAADLDGDCTVGINDFLLLVANWTV